jgi:TonB-dependent starch-binding outer membrane protein SusC
MLVTLENKGIEFTLGGWIVDAKKFKWRTDLNFAANENKVLDLGSSTIIRGPGSVTITAMLLTPETWLR